MKIFNLLLITSITSNISSNANAVGYGLAIINDSDHNLWVEPLTDDGKWWDRKYAGDDFCNKYVSGGLSVPAHISRNLTNYPTYPNFWSLYGGHYCRYSISDDEKNVIGLKYAGSDSLDINLLSGSDDGAYAIEGRNSTDLDFTTDKGDLRINNKS